jgi:hypothetical protein
MIIQKQRLAGWALSLGLGLAAGAASADTMTWNLGGGCPPGPCSASPSGPTLSSVTAWSSSNGTNTAVWQAATLGEYGSSSGVGVSHSGEPGNPQHAVDNAGGRFDTVLLSFATAVTLSGVTIGWRDTDSDISVLAFDGNQANASISGKNYSQINTNGWKLVGQYGGPSGSTDSNADIAVNTAGSFTSKLWLIGAYNPNFVGPAGETLNSPSTSYKDHVKILAFAATTTQKVPEPSSSSLLLVAAGAMGLWWRRRKAA